MSLLNDVLKDLSSRGVEQSADAANDLSYRIQQKSGVKSTASFARVLGPIILFSGIFILVYGLKSHFTTQSNGHPQAISQPLAPSESKQPLVNSSVPSPVIANADLESIAVFLKNARLAFERDRLTAPIEDNAFIWYRSALALDAANEIAISGIQSIAARYLAMSEKAEAEGNLQQAEKYIERARFVDAEYVAKVEKSRRENLVNDASGQLQSEKAPNELTSKDPLPAKQESIAPFVVAEVANTGLDSAASGDVQVSKSAEQLDLSNYNSAQQLVAAGDLNPAIELLKQSLKNLKSPPKSTQLLLDLYIQQNQLDVAKVLLDNANYLPESVRILAGARIQSGLGQDQLALSSLQPYLQSNQSNEPLLHLAAGLEHRLGHYGESQKLYESLIRQFGQKSVYCLGLALALDNLGRANEALNVYKLLSARTDIQPAVKNYIHQRIDALTHG